MFKRSVLLGLAFNIFIWLPVYLFLFLPWLKISYLHGFFNFWEYAFIQFSFTYIPFFTVILIMALELYQTRLKLDLDTII